jgi:hypothetical protein
MVVDVERKGTEIKVSRSVNWGFCFCLFTWIFGLFFPGEIRKERDFTFLENLKKVPNLQG